MTVWASIMDKHGCADWCTMHWVQPSNLGWTAAEATLINASAAGSHRWRTKGVVFNRVLNMLPFGSSNDLDHSRWILHDHQFFIMSKSHQNSRTVQFMWQKHGKDGFHNELGRPWHSECWHLRWRGCEVGETTGTRSSTWWTRQPRHPHADAGGVAPAYPAGCVCVLRCWELSS